jgi:hypothetical protein
MNKRTADALPVNASSRPVHTFSIAALLEMSTGCFSTILKQNFRAWSETSSSPRPKFPREKVEDQSAELFFKQDVIHKEFVPEWGEGGWTVNSTYRRFKSY